MWYVCFVAEKSVDACRYVYVYKPIYWHGVKTGKINTW